MPEPTRPITLKLRASDGTIFEVAKPVAMRICFVKDMLCDVDVVDGMRIPMGTVTAPILEKVIDFCAFHHEHRLTPHSAEEIDAWETAFVQVDMPTLFLLLTAANFLNVQPLLDLACKTVADMIKGKSREQIREEFAIDDSFTTE